MEEEEVEVGGAVHEEAFQNTGTEAEIGREARVVGEAAAEVEDEEGVAGAIDRTTTSLARLLRRTNRMQREYFLHHSREEGASLVLA